MARSLPPGTVMPLAEVPGGGDEFRVRVRSEDARFDVAVLLLTRGHVSNDRDLLFFNRPMGHRGAVKIDLISQCARISPRLLEQHVDRILVAVIRESGGDLRRADITVEIGRRTATALITSDVTLNDGISAASVLEAKRGRAGWTLRSLDKPHKKGFAGLLRAVGFDIHDDGRSCSVSRSGRGRVRRGSKVRTGVAAFGTVALAGVTTAVLVVALSTGRQSTGNPTVVSSAALPVVSAVASSDRPASRPPLPAAASAGSLGLADAQAELAALPVKGRAASTNYDREQFGQAWADVDRNGCDTRNDVLRRDMGSIRIDPATGGCVVLSGTVYDPYSGSHIDFVRGTGTSDAVQIDHVVSLGNAWVTGAQTWTAERRVEFANDPRNLRAVAGALNQQKGAGDAATWMPPNRAFRCTYVAQQVRVKTIYGLWVTTSERSAIAGVLRSCIEASEASSSPADSAPPPAQTQWPTTILTAPAPRVTAPGTDVYYRNCTAARAAGASDILVGEPGYRPGLDRDGDGVACES